MSTRIGAAIFRLEDYKEKQNIMTIEVMRLLNKINEWKIGRCCLNKVHSQYSTQKWPEIMKMMMRS